MLRLFKHNTVFRMVVSWVCIFFNPTILVVITKFVFLIMGTPEISHTQRFIQNNYNNPGLTKLFDV